MATGVVYSGFDNAPVLQFEDAGEPYDLSSATKFSVRIDGQAVDSVADPSKFDLSDLAAGRLGLKLGDLEIDPGMYPIRVVVFGPGAVGGHVWAHEGDLDPTEIRIL